MGISIDELRTIVRRVARARAFSLAVPKANVSDEAVIAELGTLQARLAAAHPEDIKDWTSAALLPVKKEIVGEIGPSLWALGGAGALVWLLVCINIANLAVVRAADRRRELAVRFALGATPVDIMWLVVGQGLRLSVAGAVVGVGGALALSRLLGNVLYQTSPADLGSFCLATSTLIAAVVVATTIPAKRASRLDPSLAMRID